MFTVRDYSLFMPSPNATRSFRRLRRLDRTVQTLLGLLVLLAMWNIGRLVHLRAVDNQALADVTDIADDLSTRLIWLVTVLTLAVIGVREWLVGERSFSMVYPLTAMLALVLIPATMTEIQPQSVDHTLRVMMFRCPPKAVVNGELRTIQVCDPRAIGDGDVLLATSDPAMGEIDLIDPVSGGQNTIAFTMSGRGTYTVYFMFRHESAEACANTLLVPTVGSLDDVPSRCVERDDGYWQVLPYTTSGNSPSGVNLAEVVLP